MARVVGAAVNTMTGGDGPLVTDQRSTTAQRTTKPTLKHAQYVHICKNMH